MNPIATQLLREITLVSAREIRKIGAPTNADADLGEGDFLRLRPRGWIFRMPTGWRPSDYELELWMPVMGTHPAWNLRRAFGWTEADLSGDVDKALAMRAETREEIVRMALNDEFAVKSDRQELPF